MNSQVTVTIMGFITGVLSIISFLSDETVVLLLSLFLVVFFANQVCKEGQQ